MKAEEKYIELVPKFVKALEQVLGDNLSNTLKESVEGPYLDKNSKYPGAYVKKRSWKYNVIFNMFRLEFTFKETYSKGSSYRWFAVKVNDSYVVVESTNMKIGEFINLKTMGDIVAAYEEAKRDHEFITKCNEALKAVGL